MARNGKKAWVKNSSSSKYQVLASLVKKKAREMVIWKKQKKVHLVLIVSNTQWMDMKRQDKTAFST